jgi:hypothetical protein
MVFIFAGVLQYRCYGNNGQHGRETYTPYQDIGNRSIAAFLMAMGPYSCEYIHITTRHRFRTLVPLHCERFVTCYARRLCTM